MVWYDITKKRFHVSQDVSVEFENAKIQYRKSKSNNRNEIIDRNGVCDVFSAESEATFYIRDKKCDLIPTARSICDRNS
jgi:hypothetical protein